MDIENKSWRVKDIDTDDDDDACRLFWWSSTSNYYKIKKIMHVNYWQFIHHHHLMMINTMYVPSNHPTGHHHISIPSSLSFTTCFLTIHRNFFSNGCVTKRTSSHSRYIGSTISTQTIMIARTKQDSFLSILTDHTKIINIYTYKYTYDDSAIRSRWSAVV